jgi:hypothetical protein
MIQRLTVILAVLALLQACGGGGSSAPPTPSVSISGNAGTYWQDDAVNIQFSASNMDLATVSYTVAGSLGNNNFVVDSQAGTFKDVADDFMDAGDYSLTVTATDGAGKTASRSFQLTVDLVPTGVLAVCDPAYGCDNSIRKLFFNTTRDGVLSISGRWLDTSQITGFDGQNFSGNVGFVQLTCFGQVAVDADTGTGEADCGGALPVVDPQDPLGPATDFVGVSRVEFDIDSASEEGNVRFYDASGALLETWPDASNEALEQFQGWPTNSELAGQYVFAAVDYQYDHFVDALLPNFFQSFDQVSAHVMSAPFVNLMIDSQYQIEGGDTASGPTACTIDGNINSIALSEYESVHSPRGYPWQTGYRVMSSAFTATGCDESIFNTLEQEILGPLGGGEPAPHNISQSVGEASVLALRFNTGTNSGIALNISGHGDGRPFSADLIKICDINGEPEPVNQDFGFGVCLTP